MAEDTKIQWTHHSWSPWHGCAKISDGCANCYAATMSKRNPGTLGVWGANGSRVVAAEASWRKVMAWDRAAAKAGERHRVFPSICDPFEDWIGPIKNAAGFDLWHLYPPSETWVSNPGDVADKRLLTLDDVRSRLFRLIDATPNLDWLLLTKRPENIAKMMATKPHQVTHRGGFVQNTKTLWQFPNVWLGVSVEDQPNADNRIPELLKIPAAVRFLSCEPLLGPIEFSDVSKRSDAIKQLGKKALDGIDWVIAGGESGPGARPCNIEWIRSIVRQCQAAGTSCFVKQLGSKPYTSELWDSIPNAGKKYDWSIFLSALSFNSNFPFSNFPTWA